ncbi:hypothetical protein GLOTRDRAFT_44444, partial [Gloeophyllum trabeum ATCC 11539]
LVLSREEAAESSRGTLQPHKITTSAFLVAGLELEEDQQHLRLYVTQQKDLLHSSKAKADLQDTRNKLQYHIDLWHSEQHVYMLFVSSQLLDANSSGTAEGLDFDDVNKQQEDDDSICTHSEHQPLWLPSCVSN